MEHNGDDDLAGHAVGSPASDLDLVEYVVIAVPELSSTVGSRLERSGRWSSPRRSGFSTWSGWSRAPMVGSRPWKPSCCPAWRNFAAWRARWAAC